MIAEMTPAQVGAVHIRITTTCTNIRVEKSTPERRDVDVSFFDRQRLIETVRIQPGGRVKVIS